MRPGTSPVIGAVQVSATGNEYPVSCVQDHHNLEGVICIVRPQWRNIRRLQTMHPLPTCTNDVPGMKEAAQLGEEQLSRYLMSNLPRLRASVGNGH